MKIKVKLNLHKKTGEIVKLGRIEEAELLEYSEDLVSVMLSNGDVISRKKPHQVVMQEEFVYDKN